MPAAPAKIIDCIVVHELSHMHHRDHTDWFRNEVDKVMPTITSARSGCGSRGAKMDV